MVIIGSDTYPYVDSYYQEEYLPEEYYYGGYYLDPDYLESFGYAYDEQGNLYICPRDDYYTTYPEYLAGADYMPPPAYLVGPEINIESYYLPAPSSGGYGWAGMVNSLLRRHLTPYNYHRTTYYWNRFSHLVRSEPRFGLFLPVLLTLSPF